MRNHSIVMTSTRPLFGAESIGARPFDTPPDGALVPTSRLDRLVCNRRDEKLSDIGTVERLPNFTVSGSPRSDFSFEEYAS